MKKSSRLRYDLLGQSHTKEPRSCNDVKELHWGELIETRMDV